VCRRIPEFVELAGALRAGDGHKTPTIGTVLENLLMTSALLDSVLAGVDAPPPRTLVEVFDASERNWPTSLALEDGQRRLTYAELKSEAERLAAQLANMSIGPGDRVV